MDNELLKLQTLLNDEELFGPMKVAAVVNCKAKLAKVYGESYMGGLMNC